MKILLLASQHGDEHLGEKLYSYMQYNRPELLDYMEFIIANPKAREQNIRYIESDINRSYNGKLDTYEERRAAEILNIINDSSFDLVLDLHTTTIDQPPCLIMASINPANEQFIKATSITRLVIMQSPLVDTSLSGVCQQSVSVEVNHAIADDLLNELCDDIARYIKGKTFRATKYTYIAEPLRKSEVNANEFKKLRNFERSEAGFMPILVGENSYQKHGYDYLGFKAYERNVYTTELKV